MSAPFGGSLLMVLKSVVRRSFGPTGYGILRNFKRQLSDLRRSGKPREHWKSFASDPPAQLDGGEIRRAYYQHHGRLIQKWDHYLEIYETFLSPLRSRETLRLLEIGVDHGGSLQLWRKYFGSKARIAGLDISPKTEFSDDNIRVFI